MKSTPLKYFHQVARLGSMRKAAEYLNLVPSAVSRQISMLEHELGHVLIDRQSRGIRLTDAGILLAEHLQSADIELRVLHGQLDEIRGGQRGSVRIAAIEGAIAQILPRALLGMQEKHPQVTTTVSILGSVEAAEWLREGEVDLALVFQARDLSRLEVLAERQDPFCAVVHPLHPLASLSSIGVREIGEHLVVLNEASYATRMLVNQLCGDAGVTLRVACTINSIEGAKGMARAGVGIIFLPAFAVERETRQGELVCVPISDAAVARTSLSLLARRHRRMPRSCEIAKQFLIRELQCGS